MTGIRDAQIRTSEMYARMEANLFEATGALAAVSAGAAFTRVPEVAVASFPTPPEREFFNNAIFARGLDRSGSLRALMAAEQSYAEAGIERYALWAHSTERESIALLEAHHYVLDTTTSAMAMALDECTTGRPDVDVREETWQGYLGFLELEGAPAGLLEGAEDAGFHVRIAYLDGEPVGAAIAFDHGGDCGIYNVGTLPWARRRGVGAALTAAHLHDARERGCSTASLQATPMAERLYASVGFQSLGRFIEYVPPPAG